MTDGLLSVHPLIGQLTPSGIPGRAASFIRSADGRYGMCCAVTIKGVFLVAQQTAHRWSEPFFIPWEHVVEVNQ